VTVFFTSDTHFGHGGALGLYRRPFASAAAMNEALIERWNVTVGSGDEVWHLGDFAIRQPGAVVAQLLGRLMVLCHYPFRSWRRMDKGAFDLHGHCHGRLAPQPRQVDVGVDSWDFRPVTLAQIREHRGRPKAAVVKLGRPGQNPLRGR
jgi:calcineurin-like phosphoesterase family protein